MPTGKQTLRKADERGLADLGWLRSRHTFSFGDYHDPAHMGFRSLRVINDDRIAAGKGFGMHPHRDMEIVSYVAAGALEHADSMGNGSVIRPGDVQRMTAGTGVRHSEFNPSPTEETHLIQIWILPERRGLEPGYEQRHFTEAARRDALCLIGAPDGRSGAVTIHQDVRLYATILEPGVTRLHKTDKARHTWVQVVGGQARVNGTALAPGDGLAISDAAELTLTGIARAELLLFDLA